MKNRIGWSSSSIFLNCFLVRCSFIIIGIQVGIEAGCDRKRGVVRLRPGLCVPPGRRPASSWPDQIAGGDPQIHSFDISEMRKISSFPKGVTDNIIIDFLLEFDQMGFKQKLLKSIEFLLAFKRLAVKLPWHLCSRFEVSYCSFMTGCGNSGWVQCNLDYLISVHVHVLLLMSSIQIDTKSLLNWLFTICSTISNCPSFQAIWNGVFHYVRLIDAVRLLDTLEWPSEGQAV